MKVFSTKLFVGLFVLIAFQVQAQWGGPTSVYVGETETYYYDDGLFFGDPSFIVTGGSVVGIGENMTEYSVTINWETVGTGTIQFTDGFLGNIGTNYVSVLTCATAFTVSSSSAVYCEGSGVTISLNGSQTGVSYQLKRNGINVGSPLNGTNGALQWTNNTAVGTYSVTGTRTSVGCSSEMGSVSIYSGTVPTVFTLSGGGSYCAGSTGPTITLSGSQSNHSYTLYRDGNLVSSLAGNNGALSWTNLTSNGTYTVTAYGGSCSKAMSGNVVVSTNALPTSSYSVSGGGSYCSPSQNGVTISLNGSQTGVNYQLKNGAANVGSPVAGTSGTLNWNNVTAAGTYTIVGTNASTSCISTMTGSSVVSIVAEPNVYTLTGGGAYCAGATAPTITLGASQSGYTYNLYRNGTYVSALAGNNSSISWTNVATAGTYTVSAYAGSCPLKPMSGSAVVTVNALPLSTYSVSGGGSYCSPGQGGVTISLSGSQTGVNYQLKNGASNVGSPVAGTGSALGWSSITAAGTYTVVGTNVSTSCYSTMTGSAIVSIQTGTVGGTISPVLTEAYTTASPTLTLSGHTGSIVKWQKFTGSWTDVANTTTSLTATNTTVNTQYRAVVKNGACPDLNSAVATINVYGVPVVTGASAVGNQSSIVLSAPTGYYSYQWMKNGSNISGATANTLTVLEPANYQVTVKATSTSATSTSAIKQVASVLNTQSNINFHIVTQLKSSYTTMPNIYLLALDKFGQQIEYSDGLGRPVQTVGFRQSYNQKDVVVPMAYDQNGRASKNYMPYAETTSSHGVLKVNAITSGTGYTGSDQYSFYQTASKVATSTVPFAETQHETSPLGRVLQQGAQGTDWQLGSGHTVRADYRINTADAAQPEALKSIRLWTANGFIGTYSDGKLFVNKTIDENNNETWVYTDQLGRTILKRVQLNETLEGQSITYLETYYVYDDIGNLIMQVPPKAMAKINSGTAWSTAFRDEWCFVYTYDSRNRLVEKKVPGAVPTYYVYDPLDRMTLLQDGNLRALNKWIFVKYDMKGRPTMQGLYLNATQTTRATVQVLADSLYKSTNPTYGLNTWYEGRGATLHGYTNVSFPKINSNGSAIEVLTVNYYDNCDFDNSGADDFLYISQGLTGEHVQSTAFNLPTGSKQVVIGPTGITTTWLSTYLFYDKHGRMIQARTNNYLSATIDNLVTNVYNFEGRLITSKRYHNAGGTNITTVINKYTYDHTGRLLKVFQNNNAAPTDQLLAQYEYNELGQLVDKKLHNTTGTNFLQSVDYRYNIRGWLSSINNSKLDVDSKNDETTDYFGMELIHNTAEAGLGNTLYYNGNISAQKWKGPGNASGTDGQRSNKYTYDKSNRLKSSAFKAFGTTAWDKEVGTLDEIIGYDANGNIKSIQRYENLRGLGANITITSTPQLIDNLTYTYASGNTLTKVDDAIAGIPGAKGFKNGSTITTEYSYNTDGSLTADQNKGISAIAYNVLGKPQQITFTDGRSVAYTYDASGNKLRMVTTVSGVSTTTDYVGGFVYTNNALSFFGSPEGRVVKNGSALEYQYSIADHQGNTRLVFSSTVPAAQATPVVNFEATSNSNVLNYPTGGNRSAWDLFNRTTPTPPNTYSHLLNGGNNSKVGVAKSYKVYPGDKVKIEAYAKYYNAQSTSVDLTSFAASLAGAFGLNASSTGEAAKAYQGLNSYGTVVNTGNGPGNTTFPKLFVTILIFDKDHKFLNIAYEQINGGLQSGVSPKTAHDYMMREYTVTEEGYAYAYISNESPTYVEAYFDDVTFTYTPSNIVQYNEYYPFGLQTANSWTRENATGNAFLYNSASELNNITNNYEMLFREYDPAIGRMNAIDPMASKYSSITPYNYALNDPLFWNDPTGAEAYADGISDEIQRRDAKLHQYYTSIGLGEAYSQVGSAGQLQAGYSILGVDQAAKAANGTAGYNNGVYGYWTNNNYTEYQYFIDKDGALRRTGTVVVMPETFHPLSGGSPQILYSGIGFSNSSDALFTVNAVLGFTGVGVAIQGKFWKTNEWWNIQKNGKIRFIGDKLWNNNFVKASRTSTLNATSGLRTFSNYLAGASILLTAYNVYDKGEFKASDAVNTIMAGISFTGVGSLIAGAYFLTDFGLTVCTGQGLGDMIDELVGGPIYDFE